MKDGKIFAMFFNGSPRKGNTMHALNALKEGLAQIPDTEVTEIICHDKTIVPCKACNACGSMSRCIFADDSPEINAAVEAADAVVFATPVYYWGMTAQMKLVVDKFYARDSKLKGAKKAGSIVIGEAQLDDPEYEIIGRQIACISEYMGWEMAFERSYSADKPKDLAENEAALAEIRGLAQLLV